MGKRRSALDPTVDRILALWKDMMEKLLNTPAPSGVLVSAETIPSGTVAP
jgi:thiamine biosynthesis lipoprotein ApbE